MKDHYFPATTYFIEDKATLKIGEQEYQTTLTYTLYIGKGKNAGYDTTIERSNLKTNQQKIDTKFLKIANQYMESLFPLRCRIQNYRLIVGNLAEIKERIQKTDKIILNNYSGEGLGHIRKNFLKAVEDEDYLRDFIKQLHFIKLLNFGMQKFEKKQDYFFKWNILPIGFSEWRGKMDYNIDKNQLAFEPKIDDAQKIMDNIIQYIHKYDYNVDFEEENLCLFTDFKLNIDYTGESGSIKTAKTEVCIEVENKFFYEQKITLTNK